MKAVNITILFDGQAEAALSFYKSIFGGEYANFQRMREMPNAPPMSADDGDKILYAAYPIGNSIIMVMDSPASHMVVNKGNNFMVTLDTESETETEHAFNGLAEGGLVTMPLAHQFWGAYFGMLTDKFGIQWMVSYVKQ